MKVINILPNLSMGGGQIVVLRHLRIMAALGLRPVVAYCRPVRDLETLYLDAGVELVDLGYEDLRDGFGACRRLVRFIRSHGVDIVQTHGTPLDKYFGHVAAVSTEAAHVTTFHGNPPQAWQAKPGIRAAARTLSKKLIFRGDWWLNTRTLRGIVAVSDAAMESWRPIVKARGLDRRAAIEVIYSGIPIDEFSKVDPKRIEEVRTDLLGSKRGPVVLVVSRLWPGKDVAQAVDIMPQVLRHHPGAVLAIAGDGPLRPDIEARIRRLSLDSSVRLLGQCSEVPLLLQAADLLVFPSKNEGFGLVALEALASALPVVCFGLPSLERLRSDVPALQTVAEPTVAALSQRVSRLLADTDALAELGQQAQKVVAQKWNVETSADAYLAFYDRLLSSPEGNRT